MSKNIYQMLNDIETDFTDYPAASLSQSEKKKLQKSITSRLHLHKSHKGLIAAACIIVCGTVLIAGPFRGEAKAAAESLTYRIADFFGLNSNLAPYEQIIGQTVDSNGIAITLNSVILDNDELVVSSLQEQKSSDANLNEAMQASVYINGELIEGGARGGSLVDGTTAESVMRYSLKGVDTAKTMNIKLVFTPFDNSSGKWKFAFTADGASLKADTKEISLDQPIVLTDGTKMNLTRMTSNALGQKIYFQAKNYDYSGNYLVLKGNDNLGNPVEFYVTTGDKNGGQLEVDSFASSLSPDAKELTLTPYVSKTQQGSSESKDLTAEASTDSSGANHQEFIGDEDGAVATDIKPAGETFTIKLP